jgi:hypothetical protein
MVTSDAVNRLSLLTLLLKPTCTLKTNIVINSPIKSVRHPGMVIRKPPVKRPAPRCLFYFYPVRKPRHCCLSADRYGGDDINKASIPYGKAEIKAPSLLMGYAPSLNFYRPFPISSPLSFHLSYYSHTITKVDRPLKHFLEHLIVEKIPCLRMINNEILILISS